MIGNDLVDRHLASTESNWKRKGWLDKIFTKQEQFYLKSAEDKEMMVWVFWSCKEAAYKIYHRETKVRAFIPLQLECSDIKIIHGFGVGEVTVFGLKIYTKTTVNTDFIHSIGVLDVHLFTKIHIDFSDRNVFKVYEIQKDTDGIPFLLNRKTGDKKIASISHHGRFCSYIST